MAMMCFKTEKIVSENGAILNNSKQSSVLIGALSKLWSVCLSFKISQVLKYGWSSLKQALALLAFGENPIQGSARDAKNQGKFGGSKESKNLLKITVKKQLL